MNSPKNIGLKFTPPSPENIRRLSAPMRYYFSPTYYGLDHLEKKRSYLFVANHTVHGFLDVMVYGPDLYLKKGINLRGLADHIHYKIPLWRNMLNWIGAVPGTRENCSKLMQAGENIIIFPGGAREVCKRKGEAYKLIWKRRTGFVRLAIEHNYPIIPIAVIGMENAFSILIDGNDMLNSAFGKVLRLKGIANLTKNGEQIPPITRGIGLTPFPRPERIYVSFGMPIESTSFQGQYDNQEALFALRNQVENALNNQIRELLHLREQNVDSGIIRRFLNRL